MIYFAPSIYVLQYLDKSNLDHTEIRTRALGYLMEGMHYVLLVRSVMYTADDPEVESCVI